WTVEYFFQSLKILFDADRPPVGELHTIFKDFSTGLRPVVWTLVFLTANALVLLRGVKRGIEKVSNILMPVLFILLVVFCINSLLMDGAADGLRFLFYPDFSKVNSSMMIGALGQAFFSLSLGLGTMMIYASYFSDRTPLIKSASTTAALDTLVALLAGIMIFPAVFTFGVAPAAGPELVFEVLPSVFRMMPFGDIWSLMFFFLLMVASLTSTISMSELCVAFFTEQFNMSRRCAVLINTATTMILGTLCALSFGLLSDIQLCGKTIFNLFDYLSSNIMLPLGGMAIAFFVGWKVSPAIVNAQLGNAPGWLKKSIMVSLRYIAPAGIGLVFLSGLQLW
ncbi:MAG: sodium-dependent transporter, partial [Muribaculum sp.]|nr:sodium-dependent transporter [Muribaculum sp.]